MAAGAQVSFEDVLTWYLDIMDDNDEPEGAPAAARKADGTTQLRMRSVRPRGSSVGGGALAAS